MKLSLKYYPRWDDKALAIIDDLSFHTTRLYNTVNYEIVQNGLTSNYYDLEKQFKYNWHRGYLHSHNYQQCLKLLSQNYSAYYSSLKDFKQNPHKYKGMPRPPKFKNLTNNKNEVIFTKLAIRVSSNGLIKLSLSKLMQTRYNVNSLNLKLDVEVLKRLDVSAINQLRLAYDHRKSKWSLIIIYMVADQVVDSDFENIMGIDLGLNNICAMTFKDNTNQILISGRRAKSKNAYFNKEIAKLNSLNMKSLKDARKHKMTRRIKSLYNKRNDYMKDFSHKVSHTVIRLALENGCNTIVIGDLKDIKQHKKMKSFVQIPIALIVCQIKYKAMLVGITVTLINESYTSKTSAIDLEDVKKHAVYLGNRTKRGLFVTAHNILINADINGSLNILRKYLSQKHNTCNPRLVQQARANGYVSNPTKIMVA